MSDLVVIVPSRGRPEAARALAQVIKGTCQAGTALLLAVDDDDPTLAEYERIPAEYPGLVSLYVTSCRPATMVSALNVVARAVAGLLPAGDDWAAFDPPPLVSVTAAEPTFAVGYMGDDHRPRTHGWDVAYLDALRDLGTGIVYGNDLLQGQALPTQCAMTVDIVRALGYMAPPDFTHLFVDNVWKTLGERAGCLRYLPDVVVEHVHPFALKAPMDEGYERVNARDVATHDEGRYRVWLAKQCPAAVTAVKALRGAR